DTLRNGNAGASHLGGARRSTRGVRPRNPPRQDAYCLLQGRKSQGEAPEHEVRLPRLQCAAETWKGVLHERLKSCLKAAQMMRAGPSGSAFRSGSQTTPSCCVQKAWW